MTITVVAIGLGSRGSRLAVSFEYMTHTDTLYSYSCYVSVYITWDHMLLFPTPNATSIPPCTHPPWIVRWGCIGVGKRACTNLERILRKTENLL